MKIDDWRFQMSEGKKGRLRAIRYRLKKRGQDNEDRKTETAGRSRKGDERSESVLAIEDVARELNVLDICTYPESGFKVLIRNLI